MLRYIVCLLCFWAIAYPAQAETRKVTERSEFVKLVSGKTLARPLVRLKVTSKGSISGTGAQRSVSGRWVWQNGFFCRRIYWGKSDLGYNCQEVTRTQRGQLRFTSDRGKGRSADFWLR